MFKFLVYLRLCEKMLFLRFFMKAQVAQKGVILHNSFFMSYAWASVENKWQCSAYLKSELVLIFSELKKCKVTFGFKYTYSLVK